MINYIKLKNILIYLLLVTALVLIIIDYLFRIMYFIPEGEIIKSIQSPDKNHTMNAYIVESDSTTGIRVEIVFNKENKTKNIYWSYPEEVAIMQWLDNETVLINNIKLNIYKDCYRKEYKYQDCLELKYLRVLFYLIK